LASPGDQYGSIAQSYANVNVSGGTGSVLGGLAAGSEWPISQSYAQGIIAASVRPPFWLRSQENPQINDGLPYLIGNPPAKKLQGISRYYGANGGS